MKKKNYIAYLLVLFMLGAGNSFAQLTKAKEAYNLIVKQKYDSARVLIEEVVLHPETKNNPLVWYYKGFIYKELYKTKELNNKRSSYRTEAVSALMKSIRMDTLKKDSYTDCVKNLGYLSSRHYNDVVSAMDTVNYPIAIENYEKYRQITLFLDPNAELKKKDTEFHMALAGVYEKLYNANRKRTNYFELARNTYKKVLELSPNHESANYNLGLLYYNQGVNLIKQTDYDTPIVSLYDIQAESVELFKQALPYMLKVYEINPARLETVIALTGIYFGLNENEKYEFYREKQKELEKKK